LIFHKRFAFNCLGFQCLNLRGTRLLTAAQVVFLSGKAETRVETRHVFHHPLQNREEFPEATSRNLK